jgi:hypothetical protein
VEGHRQPVYLQLRDVGDLPLPDHAEDALLELPQLLRRVGVVEAQHGRPVDDGRKRLGRLLAHALGRAVRRDEVRVERFEPA